MKCLALILCSAGLACVLAGIAWAQDARILVQGAPLVGGANGMFFDADNNLYVAHFFNDVDVDETGAMYVNAEGANVIHKLRSHGNACGLGFELALVLPALEWWRRRRRRTA